MAGVGRPPKGKAKPVPGVVSNPKEVGEISDIPGVVSDQHEASNTGIPGCVSSPKASD